MIRFVRDFTTQEEADALITVMAIQGATLVEVQNYADGNHLVFEMEGTETDVLQTQIEALDVRVTALEG